MAPDGNDITPVDLGPPPVSATEQARRADAAREASRPPAPDDRGERDGDPVDDGGEVELAGELLRFEVLHEETADATRESEQARIDADRSALERSSEQAEVDALTRERLDATEQERRSTQARLEGREQDARVVDANGRRVAAEQVLEEATIHDAAVHGSRYARAVEEADPHADQPAIDARERQLAAASAVAGRGTAPPVLRRDAEDEREEAVVDALEGASRIRQVASVFDDAAGDDARDEEDRRRREASGGS